MDNEDRAILLSVTNTVSNLANSMLKIRMEVNAIKTTLTAVHYALHKTPELQELIERCLKIAIETDHACALGTSQTDEMLQHHQDSLSKLIPPHVWEKVKTSD